ncbi:DUF4129 domain-containing protein [Hymenobacter sp. H14-R3]|uniref:DUF4129 domain-containing protein n=1 Tax=Hymenobacter sp. H14-R3 TaxID=3046308 RepID=UPI0024BA3845|nr:DUF4129 domain-containing protein [Hymenobacter sp. H14-R3]MDJ0365083.1 DUF4129 domain-containing protein [Hymenobacter sp. H14-R3]
MTNNYLRNINISAKRGRRALLLLALAASGPPAARAQGPPAVLRRLAQARADTATAPPLPPDAAPATVRRPAAERLRELRGQRDFQYTEVAEEPATASWWQRLLGWVLRQVGGLQSTQGGRVAWNTIFYCLLGAGVVFAVLKFLQVDITRMFGRAPRRAPLAYETSQENIHELNFAEAIAQAEATGNLRLAGRLGYLHLLKQLTDRDLIAWQPDKTNQAYLLELAASYPAAHPAFAQLTRQFAYSWYGELPVSAASYQAVRADQHRLSQQLSGARAQPA